jgi:hypothetical protein
VSRRSALARIDLRVEAPAVQFSRRRLEGEQDVGRKCCPTALTRACWNATAWTCMTGLIHRSSGPSLFAILDAIEYVVPRPVSEVDHGRDLPPRASLVGLQVTVGILGHQRPGTC